MASAGLLVDEAGDALHTTTAGEAADGRLGDALHVVAENLVVALGAALAEALAALTASCEETRYGSRGGEHRADRESSLLKTYWSKSLSSW